MSGQADKHSTFVSPTRDGRYDRNLVTVGYRSLEPSPETGILIVEVEGNERVGPAPRILEPGRQLGKTFGYSCYHFAQGASTCFQRGLSVRQPGQNGGKAQCY
jgi:hypothetical protein